MIPTTRKSARKTTSVTIKTPEEPPVIHLRDLSAGTWFGINGDANVYVRTDETLGRGYRCLRVKDGHLVPFEMDTVIDKVYSSVNVTVN